jgi:nucleoside-diphosphate-sugar epimerase
MGVRLQPSQPESPDMTTSQQPTALVIGATGGIGGEVAHALIAHGWRVRALARNPAAAQVSAGWIGPIEWVAGDAMHAADVIAAAQGTQIIVHGANPPGYRNWRGLALPMLNNSIAAARTSGARLILPGNVYNYGPDAGSVVTETSPQHPTTRKGKVRVEMEQLLETAANDGVRSLVVRAGDFFGPHQPMSWFGDGIVKRGKPLTSVTYPGTPDAGHAWAFLPDLAETIARLADIETTLPAFERVHFSGQWLERGIEIAESIRRVAGNPKLPIKRLPWAMLYLAAPFVTFMREALEMRYLWDKPLRLDNTKLLRLIGNEPHTPLDDAVRDTLTALGCLPAPQPHRAPTPGAAIQA